MLRCFIITALIFGCGALMAAPTQDILISPSSSVSVPVIGAVDDEDAIFFAVTAAGSDGTDGVFVGSPILDMSAFAPTFDTALNLDAIHYFQRPVTFPGLGLPWGDTVPAGSLALSFDTDGASLPQSSGGSLNGVRDEDLVLFVPDTLGDFSSGMWYRFFDGSDVGLVSSIEGADIDAMCVIEQDITIGGVTLLAGDLLISVDGVSAGPFFGGPSDVMHFRPTDMGTSTAGAFLAWPLFLGTSEGMDWPGPPDESIEGIHMTAQDLQIGDEVIPAGSLIMSIAGTAASIGSPEDLVAENEDIFHFVPTQLGDGTWGIPTIGSFSPLLDGSSTAMGLSATGADALTLIAYPVLSTQVTALDLNGGALLRGDTVQLTLEIENTSPAHATGVAVMGDIDSDTDGLIVTDAAGGVDASTSDHLDVSGLVISPESTVTIVCEVDVKTDLTGGETVEFAGDVTSAAEGGSGAAFSGNGGTVVAQLLSTTSSSVQAADVTGNPLLPLDEIDYSLTLVNSVGQAATDVAIVGSVPPGTHDLNIIEDGGGNASGCTPTALDVQGITVPANSSVELRWSVIVNSDIGQAVPVQMTIDVSAPAEGGSPFVLISNDLESIPVELSVFTVE